MYLQEVVFAKVFVTGRPVSYRWDCWPQVHLPKTRGSFFIWHTVYLTPAGIALRISETLKQLQNENEAYIMLYWTCKMCFLFSKFKLEQCDIVMLIISARMHYHLEIVRLALTVLCIYFQNARIKIWEDVKRIPRSHIVCK